MGRQLGEKPFLTDLITAAIINDMNYAAFECQLDYVEACLYVIKTEYSELKASSFTSCGKSYIKVEWNSKRRKF